MKSTKYIPDGETDLERLTSAMQNLGSQKFDMVDEILPLNHNRKTIIRMSVNPEEIINKVEFGTSRLKGRIEAINKLVEAGYKIGILIAPVILVENWEQLYTELRQRLSQQLSSKAKKCCY